jgi:hypothetical protein
VPLDDPDNTTIRYSVKELLGDLHHKLDALILRIDVKADAVTVEALEKRVGKLERRTGAWAAVITFLAAAFAIGVPIALHFAP